MVGSNSEILSICVSNKKEAILSQKTLRVSYSSFVFFVLLIKSPRFELVDVFGVEALLHEVFRNGGFDLCESS